MPKKKNSPKRISAISVEGYKSLGKEAKINLAPLTVLCGVNSSGKSSFFQPFLLLKQTQEAAFNPQGVLLNGPNIQFHEAKEILAELKKGQRAKKLKVGFYFSDGTSIKNLYGKTKESSFDLLQTDTVVNGERTVIGLTSSKETLNNFFKKSLEDRDLARFLKTNNLEPHIEKKRGFFDIIHIISLKKRGGKTKGGIAVGLGEYSEAVHLARRFIDFLHVPGIRGNPERNYRFTATKGRYVGRFEDYTASIVFQWKHSSDSTDKNKLKELKRLLKKLELTTSINAQRISDVYVALEVGVLPVAKNSKLSPINIADVGFGVSQVLPILVALIEAKKEQVVYIEQPELHLHPRAQSVLAEILVEFAQKGRVVVIETHSSIMLRKMQSLIAQKKLSKDDVSFNWFNMGEDGISQVQAADLDNKGRYGDWPQDFDDVYLDVESEFIRYAG